jgi:glycosyltransferase involved in cell wall biosynthesis
LFVPSRDPHAVADALARLEHDRLLLRRLALAARARIVEHYSVVRMVQEFDVLYASLGEA